MPSGKRSAVLGPGLSEVSSAECDQHYGGNIEHPLVLVVDHDPVYVSVTASTLLDAGFKALTATTAQEAMQHFKVAKPDIVLLDYLIPDETGLELLRHIKESCPELPVVIVTSLWDKDAAAEARAAGAVDYIVKPVSADTLQVEILARLIEH